MVSVEVCVLVRRLIDGCGFLTVWRIRVPDGFGCGLTALAAGVRASPLVAGITASIAFVEEACSGVVSALSADCGPGIKPSTDFLDFGWA